LPIYIIRRLIPIKIWILKPPNMHIKKTFQSLNYYVPGELMLRPIRQSKKVCMRMLIIGFHTFFFQKRLVKSFKMRFFWLKGIISWTTQHHIFQWRQLLISTFSCLGTCHDTLFFYTVCSFSEICHFLGQNQEYGKSIHAI